MNKNKIILSSLCLAVLCAAPFCQSLLGLSQPFGLTRQPNSGLSLSMGGAGTGLVHDLNTMMLNPANLGGVSKTVFSALGTFTFLTINQNDETNNFLTFLPRQISVAFPLGRAGTVSFGMQKRTDAEMKFRSSQKLWLVAADSIFEQQALTRNGGTTIWEAGYGVMIKKWFYIGCSYERLYASVAQTQLTYVTMQGEMHSSRDTTNITLASNGIQGGIMVPINSKFTVGFSGEYFFSGDASQSQGIYSDYADTSVKSSASGTLSISLAPSLRLGASYSPSASWRYAADVQLTLWDYYHNPLNLVTQSITTAFSGGVQFIPAPNLLAPAYWEVMQYRAGLRYTEISETFVEVAADLGVGLPLRKGSSQIDLSVELGNRMDSRFNTSENIVTIGIGLGGGHKWVKSSGSDY